MEPSVTPDYIEIHDMRLRCLDLFPNGNGQIDIRHLPVYVKTGHDRYDIWSYHAKIEFRGIHMLSLDGLPTDWVIGGAILDSEQKTVPFSLRDNCNNARRIVFELNNGSHLEIHASEINLIVLEALKVVDEWAGPL